MIEIATAVLGLLGWAFFFWVYRKPEPKSEIASELKEELLELEVLLEQEKSDPHGSLSDRARDL